MASLTIILRSTRLTLNLVLQLGVGTWFLEPSPYGDWEASSWALVFGCSAALGHLEQPKAHDYGGRQCSVSITKSRVEILSVHPTEWKETWALDQGRFLV